jgi:hypothetical protein
MRTRASGLTARGKLIGCDPKTSLNDARACEAANHDQRDAPVLHLDEEQGLEELELADTIKADIQRYKDMLERYRSKQPNIGDLERGFVENTKETERHLENVIRELEALLRDRKE